MDYASSFSELRIESNYDYPRNDIGVASLFYDLHRGFIRYVMEAKTWFVYSGRHWFKDEGGFRVMECCKGFAQSYAVYAKSFEDGTPESKEFSKYAAGLTSRKRREGILSDARSIEPMSLMEFDKNKMLLNCLNGTYNLSEMALLPHNPADYITKKAWVNFKPGAVCERWERFISEVMCNDTDTACFLQKAFGYSLSGETSLAEVYIEM